MGKTKGRKGAILLGKAGEPVNDYDELIDEEIAAFSEKYQVRVALRMESRWRLTALYEVW